MKNFVLRNSLILGLLVVIGLSYTAKTQAATLKFTPATGAYTTGTAFNVEVIVDTAGKETRGADAVIIFDNALLSVDKVTYGSFYPTGLHSQQNGKLYITGLMNDAVSSKSGTGTLATISFKGLTSGSADVSFECQTGRTDDSNVYQNDLDSTDLLDCASLVKGVYTLSGSAVATPTPPPTTETLPTTDGGTGTAATTSTASTIPNTSMVDLRALWPKLLMGLVFLVAGAIPLII